MTSADLSNLDTSNTTNMSRMFDGCTSLSSLNLSGWDTAQVDDMERLFYGCSSLVSLDLTNWDTVNVSQQGAGGMFSGCSSLASITIGESYPVKSEAFFPNHPKRITGRWYAAKEGSTGKGYTNYDIIMKQRKNQDIADTYTSTKPTA